MEGSGLGLPTLKIANASSASLDKAIIYLEEHTASQSDSAAVDHVLLVRKIDRHIVPIALAAYTLQFLDKLYVLHLLSSLLSPTPRAGTAT
jgi:hypothetical protein